MRMSTDLKMKMRTNFLITLLRIILKSFTSTIPIKTHHPKIIHSNHLLTIKDNNQEFCKERTWAEGLTLILCLLMTYHSIIITGYLGKIIMRQMTVSFQMKTKREKNFQTEMTMMIVQTMMKMREARLAQSTMALHLHQLANHPMPRLVSSLDRQLVLNSTRAEVTQHKINTMQEVLPRLAKAID